MPTIAVRGAAATAALSKVALSLDRKHPLAEAKYDVGRAPHIRQGSRPGLSRLAPAIHVFSRNARKQARMPATRAGMTANGRFHLMDIAYILPNPHNAFVVPTITSGKPFRLRSEIIACNSFSVKPRTHEATWARSYVPR